MIGTEPVQLTAIQLKEIIREGVHEAFTIVGVNVDRPHEMQRDFLYLRNLRQLVESIKSKSVMTILVLVITTTFGLIGLGLQKQSETTQMDKQAMDQAVQQYLGRMIQDSAKK